MVAKLEDIKKWYAEFNAKYFKSVGRGLPDDIDIEMSSRMSRSWGYAEFVLASEDGRLYAKKLKIKINKNNDVPEKEYKNTLIHEMIHIEDYVYFLDHYYYMLNGVIQKRRYDAHGTWFLDECSRINQDGWKLQKYVDEAVFKEARSKQADMKSKDGYLLVICHCLKEWKNGSWIWCTPENPRYFMYKTNDANLNKTVKAMGSEFAYKAAVYECHSTKYANNINCATRLRGWYMDAEKVDTAISDLDLKLKKIINLK